MLKLFAVSLAFLAVFASGCAPSFRVVPVAGPAFPPAQDVMVVEKKPDRPFTVIGEFSGYERSLCASGHPYCSLYDKAKAMGADVIWITRRDVEVRPDVWVDIEGRPTRIPSSRYEHVEGVFLRLREDRN